MASIQIDGINSGLPTGELIDAEIAVLEIPLNKTKDKLEGINTFNNSLKSLSGSLNSYNDTLEDITAQDFNKYTGVSSNPGVTLDTTNATNPVSLSMNVSSVATRHSMVSASSAALNGNTISIGINGATHDLTAASNSFVDIAKAINGAGIGVNASVVSVGKDAVTGENLYRLQLTSADTGQKNQFTASIGGTDILSGAGAATLSTAADAEVVLFAGTAAEQIVTSSTNIFTGVVPGVDFTISAAAISAGTVNLDVVADPKAQAAKADVMVADLNKILSYIDSGTKVTTSGAGTTTAAKGGIFTGDLLIRGIRDELMAAVTTPMNGYTTLATIGIDIDKYGAVTFDADKYNKAMETNPNQTTQFMAELAERISKVAVNATDKYDGTLTKKLQGGESEVRSLEDQIQRHADRLDVRRDTLLKRYTTMETLMGTMNTTMKYLQSMYSTMFKKDED